MTRHRMHAAIFCAAWGASAVALAQQAPDRADAQQRYDRAIAYCNDANLPRPERDACVRDAGRALDQARGSGLAPDVDVVSPDGRSTVIVPDDAPPPSNDGHTVTSPDGRSTIVLPAGGARPVPQ